MQKKMTPYKEWLILKKMVEKQLKTLELKSSYLENKKEIGRENIDRAMIEFLKGTNRARTEYLSCAGYEVCLKEKCNFLNNLSLNDLFSLYNFLNKVLMNEKLLVESQIKPENQQKFFKFCELIKKEMCPLFDGKIEFSGAPDKIQGDEKLPMFLNAELKGEVLYRGYKRTLEYIDNNPQLNFDKNKITNNFVGLNFGNNICEFLNRRYEVEELHEEQYL